jgi:hypothetical protein
VIRQAISCDICGTEKKQTNHWFVAYDQGGELRVSGWNSRNRLRPGMKHLCGQTCLHKLVDEFMARTIAVRVQPGAAEESEVAEQTVATDCSLTSDAAFVEVESSSRLLTPPVPVLPKRLPLRAQAELVAMQTSRLGMRRATGAPKPGSGSGSGSCAPSSGVRTSPLAAGPVPERGWPSGRLPCGWTCC